VAWNAEDAASAHLVRSCCCRGSADGSPCERIPHQAARRKKHSVGVYFRVNE